MDLETSPAAHVLNVFWHEVLRADNGQLVRRSGHGHEVSGPNPLGHGVACRQTAEGQQPRKGRKGEVVRHVSTPIRGRRQPRSREVEMPCDVGSNFLGPISGKHVPPALDHHELNPEEELSEVVPDAERTDTISVTPQQEGRSLNGRHAVAQIYANVVNPLGRVRELVLVIRAPVFGSEGPGIDAAGGRSQHKPMHALWACERSLDSHDTPQGLCDQIYRTIHPLQDEADQAIEPADASVRWNMAQTGPAQQDLLARGGEEVRDRPPEGPVAGSPRQEENPSRRRFRSCHVCFLYRFALLHAS